MRLRGPEVGGLFSARLIRQRSSCAGCQDAVDEQAGAPEEIRAAAIVGGGEEIAALGLEEPTHFALDLPGG